VDFGVCVEFNGKIDPNNSTVQASLRAAAADQFNESAILATILYIESGCNGISTIVPTPQPTAPKSASLVDIGATDTIDAAADAAEVLVDLKKAVKTSMSVKLEVQLPAGQTDINDTNLTSDLESATGIFTTDLSAAWGNNVTVYVEDPPPFVVTTPTTATIPTTLAPTPKPTRTPTSSPTPSPTPTLPFTTILNVSNKNTKTLHVANSSDFRIGDRIRVNPGNPTQEDCRIDRFGSIIVKEPLIFNHAPGEMVLKLSSGTGGRNCVVSDWMLVLNCSEPCGTGFERWVRTIDPAIPPGTCQGVDKNQDGSLKYEEARECNTQPCPTYCNTTDWTEWSECSASCEGGETQRNRTVTVADINMTDMEGADEPCPYDAEVDVCNFIPCPT